MNDVTRYDNSLPIAALITGVASGGLSLFALFGLGVFTLPLGIVTLIFGLLGLKRVHAGTARPEYKGYAITGIACGAVLTVISSLWLVLIAIIMVGAAVSA